MNAEILTAIGHVYEAGARKAREWVLNYDRQQEAEILQAMADEAHAQAALLDEAGR